MVREVFNFLGSRLALTLLEQPGAARSSQEEPGGARRSQEQPGAARRSQEEPGAARRSQEQPGTASSQEISAKGSQLSDLSPFGPNTVWGVALESYNRLPDISI